MIPRWTCSESGRGDELVPGTLTYPGLLHVDVLVVGEGDPSVPAAAAGAAMKMRTMIVSRHLAGR